MSAKFIPVFAAAVLASLSATVATPASAAETVSQTAHYSVETTLVGKLLDDPAAAAILKKLIPNTFNNDMFQSMGRDQTLKGIQQYEPVDLSDENLAKIQAEFDKLPVKE
ncbi:MAG: hypothetical protein J7496_05445 [Novosphingobium sp.]|nr:hypothetical protein [Novosphingobium sp.]